jgi:hypothetical protein
VVLEDEQEAAVSIAVDRPSAEDVKADSLKRDDDEKTV